MELPVKRGGPLKRKSPLRARRPEPPEPSEAPRVIPPTATDRRAPTLARDEASPAPKQRARWKHTPDWRKVVKDRSGGVCEAMVAGVCTRVAFHVHHVWKRSTGGPDEPSNGLHVCGPCHGWIHAHEPEAVTLGLLRRRPPEDELQLSVP